MLVYVCVLYTCINCVDRSRIESINAVLRASTREREMPRTARRCLRTFQSRKEVKLPPSPTTTTSARRIAYIRRHPTT